MMTSLRVSSYASSGHSFSVCDCTYQFSLFVYNFLCQLKKDLLWTAPELLRNSNLRKKGSFTGDVYSFSIIAQEIICRSAPFCMLDMPPKGEWYGFSNPMYMRMYVKLLYTQHCSYWVTKKMKYIRIVAENAHWPVFVYFCVLWQKLSAKSKSLLLCVGLSCQRKRPQWKWYRFWNSPGVKSQRRGWPLRRSSNRWTQWKCVDPGLLICCTVQKLEITPLFPPSSWQFKSITKGKKTNIIDSMLRMLEQYSSNLEDLIRERTEELEVERQKTDNLVAQMLPK